MGPPPAFLLRKRIESRVLTKPEKAVSEQILQEGPDEHVVTRLVAHEAPAHPTDVGFLRLGVSGDAIVVNAGERGAEGGLRRAGDGGLMAVQSNVVSMSPPMTPQGALRFFALPFDAKKNVDVMRALLPTVIAPPPPRE